MAIIFLSFFYYAAVLRKQAEGEMDVMKKS